MKSRSLLRLKASNWTNPKQKQTEMRGMKTRQFSLTRFTLPRSNQSMGRSSGRRTRVHSQRKNGHENKHPSEKSIRMKETRTESSILRIGWARQNNWLSISCPIWLESMGSRRWMSLCRNSTSFTVFTWHRLNRLELIIKRKGSAFQGVNQRELQLRERKGRKLRALYTGSHKRVSEWSRWQIALCFQSLSRIVILSRSGKHSRLLTRWKKPKSLKRHRNSSKFRAYRRMAAD